MSKWRETQLPSGSAEGVKQKISKIIQIGLIKKNLEKADWICLISRLVGGGDKKYCEIRGVIRCQNETADFYPSIKLLTICL